MEKRLTKKQSKFIEIFESSLGIISNACKKANVSRRTYYNWMRDSKAFSEACEEIKDVTLDFVEHSLLKNIKKGDTTAIIFYLKTKGRDRGFVEKHEVDMTINPFLELMQEATAEDREENG